RCATPLHGSVRHKSPPEPKAAAPDRRPLRWSPTGVASRRQNLAECELQRSFLPPESKMFGHKRITLLRSPTRGIQESGVSKAGIMVELSPAIGRLGDKIMKASITLAVLLLSLSPAAAQYGALQPGPYGTGLYGTGSNPNSHYVQPYVRSNGT